MTSHDMPEPEVERVRRYCDEHVPERDRNQIRVECEITSTQLTIIEHRAPWDPASGADWSRSPIARLEYSPSSQTWQLYYRDRNARFHEYHRLLPAITVDGLLAEIDRNPGRVFWH